jgi:hypothetical protein
MMHLSPHVLQVITKFIKSPEKRILSIAAAICFAPRFAFSTLLMFPFPAAEGHWFAVVEDKTVQFGPKLRTHGRNVSEKFMGWEVNSFHP